MINTSELAKDVAWAIFDLSVALSHDPNGLTPQAAIGHKNLTDEIKRAFDALVPEANQPSAEETTKTAFSVSDLKSALSEAVRDAAKAGMPPLLVAKVVTVFAEEIEREADNVFAMGMVSHGSK